MLSPGGSVSAARPRPTAPCLPHPHSLQVLMASGIFWALGTQQVLNQSSPHECVASSCWGHAPGKAISSEADSLWRQQGIEVLLPCQSSFRLTPRRQQMPAQVFRSLLLPWRIN